nr:LytTR family DNA-binding domain-containing protein [uncultured Oscillibacter sp.]
MLRIGICDDAAGARIALRAALERALERRRSGEASFFEFSSGEGLFRWLGSHAGELDLVFLDIEMGELDGMETARRLRSSDEGLGLVFVTGYTDYVFDGYSVGALGYLMKPPKPEQLDRVLDRAAEARLREGDKAFLCRSGETLYRIPKKTILYFASDRRQVTCVAANRTYVFYGKLDDVERDVGEDFVRVHQRYLVRTASVDRMEGSQVFVGDAAIPVSRACRSAALAALARSALEG